MLHDGCLVSDYGVSKQSAMRKGKACTTSVEAEECMVGDDIHRPVKVFMKQTSKAVSASEVNAIRFSPATSLGLP